MEIVQQKRSYHPMIILLYKSKMLSKDEINNIPRVLAIIGII
jgi:hypothetical protein